MKLTDNQFNCLRYLDDKMNASSDQIGRALRGATQFSNGSYASTGAAVCVSLKKRGLAP